MPKPLRLAFDPVLRARERWRERWAADDSMAAATSVMRVQQLLLARYDAALRVHGLTFARYEALVLLTFSRAGRLPLSKIGERLMVHPTSVTNIVQRLEQAGLVDRVPNPRDGRGTLAGITAAGRAVVETATADLVALDFGLEALDAGERDELFGLLRKVRLAAEDFTEEGSEHVLDR
ncbi:MAG TPA: MarR family transcriptional regulator [Actinomycetales bacterium]|nr:MarR family transcriptional regulator [Actinomycetales bacterium]